jgi:hypothetical protein
MFGASQLSMEILPMRKRPMSLSSFPKQIEAKLPSSVSSVPWTRSVAAGTLLTSAVLLALGKRKTALAVAAAGGAVALIEDPESVRKFWDDIPNYVQAGQKLLGRLEGLVEQAAEQGGQFREMLRRL